MHIQLLIRQILRYSPRAATRSVTTNSYQQDVDETPKVNSAEYTNDGEKITCDLSFTSTDDGKPKTEEDYVIESARARAFSQGTTRVINVRGEGD